MNSSMWIECKGEFPEPTQECLVAYRFGFEVANYEEGSWWDNHGRMKYKVTHWMPIVGPNEAL